MNFCGYLQFDYYLLIMMQLFVINNIVGTIVLYSRDHKGVGVVHEVTSPKNQPQFSLTTMRQYWLGKTKRKQAFSSCF